MFVYRINVFLLCFTLIISQFFLFYRPSYAASKAALEYIRSTLIIKKMQGTLTDQESRILASYRTTYDEIDHDTGKVTTKTKHAIVEVKPKKASIGKVALERVNKFKGGIGPVLGAAAIASLIEGIGWVMEEGTYVKKKPISGNFICNDFFGDTPEGACQNAFDADNARFGYGPDHQYYQQVEKIFSSEELSDGRMRYQVCSSWKPRLGSCQFKSYSLGVYTGEETIPITPDDVGGILMGDYKDPVDSKYDDNSNKWQPPILTTYEHDPQGIENNLADDIDNRAPDAPPTPDGKPSSVSDPRYDRPLADDKDKTNDRSWDDDTAGDAGGETSPIVDPETGEKIGDSISLKFPVFCEWAFTVCNWYDKWQKTDVVVREHIKDTKKHYDDQKTFWGRVTDFFTWVKGDDVPDKQTDTDTDSNIALTPVDVNWSAQCPEKETFNFEIEGYSQEISIINFEYICQYAYIVKPVVIFGASLEAIFILAGIRRNGVDENG